MCACARISVVSAYFTASTTQISYCSFSYRICAIFYVGIWWYVVVPNRGTTLNFVLFVKNGRREESSRARRMRASMMVKIRTQSRRVKTQSSIACNGQKGR